jgi:hypothetical protein
MAMKDTTPLDVTHDVFCVLYSDSTGEIVFVHRVTTLGDARPQSDKDILAEALRNMRDSLVRYGRQLPENPSALLVPAEQLEHGRKYHVDCVSRTVRELPKASVEST